MLDPAKLPLFFVAALVLVITPGPAVIYVVTRSLAQGRGAGLASVLGVGLGNLTHVVAAALGLSAILASSAALFSFVRYAGAAYLIYLGLKKLFSPATPPTAARFDQESWWQVFRQGIVVATLNPKTALFFLAFLPQFTDPARGALWLQLSILGTITVAMGVITDSGYALLSGTLGDRFKRSRTFARSERYLSSSVYCGLGLAALFSGSHRGR